MIFRRTRIEDLYSIDFPYEDGFDADIRLVAEEQPEYESLLRKYARSMVSEGGEVVAILGVTPQWRGVGTVWAMISDKARFYGYRLTRNAIRLMDDFQSEEFWRLNATIERGCFEAREWILAIGFSYEGTMVGYGPDGKTHDMYSRLRGGSRWR